MPAVDTYNVHDGLWNSNERHNSALPQTQTGANSGGNCKEILGIKYCGNTWSQDATWEGTVSSPRRRVTTKNIEIWSMRIRDAFYTSCVLVVRLWLRRTFGRWRGRKAGVHCWEKKWIMIKPRGINSVSIDLASTPSIKQNTPISRKAKVYTHTCRYIDIALLRCELKERGE
jgi:hypothetical protein